MNKALPLLALCLPLWCLQPESFDEFENNTLRLLGSRQYSYLTEFWLSAAPRFARHPRLAELTLAACARLPRLEQRQKVLKCVCEAEGDTAARSRLYLEYGMGLLVSGDAEAAAAVLGKSREREALFHKGEALMASGNEDRARVALEAYLERGSAEFSARARMRLVELALGAGRMGDAKKLFAAVPQDSPDALILACRLAEKGGNREELAKAVANLKKRFGGLEKTEAYLSGGGGGKKGG